MMIMANPQVQDIHLTVDIVGLIHTLNDSWKGIVYYSHQILAIHSNSL